MDPGDGRRVAALEMLPRWDGFSVDGRGEKMTAWEAICKVGDVAYCMKNQRTANHPGSVWTRTSYGFDFREVKTCNLGQFSLSNYLEGVFYNY